MNVMSAIVFAARRNSEISPPIGLIHPQYLPAVAQSRLLQLRFAASPSESSIRAIRSLFRKALMRP